MIESVLLFLAAVLVIYIVVFAWTLGRIDGEIEARPAAWVHPADPPCASPAAPKGKKHMNGADYERFVMENYTDDSLATHQTYLVENKERFDSGNRINNLTILEPVPYNSWVGSRGPAELVEQDNNLLQVSSY